MIKRKLISFALDSEKASEQASISGDDAGKLAAALRLAGIPVAHSLLRRDPISYLKKLHPVNVPEAANPAEWAATPPIEFPSLDAPVVQERGFVYCAHSGGLLARVNPVTGETEPIFDTKTSALAKRRPIRAIKTLDENLIFFATEKHLYCFNLRQRKVVWKKRFILPLTANIVFIDRDDLLSTVVVATTRGVHGFDIHSGKRRFLRLLDGKIESIHYFRQAGRFYVYNNGWDLGQGPCNIKAFNLNGKTFSSFYSNGPIMMAEHFGDRIAYMQIYKSTLSVIGLEGNESAKVSFPFEFLAQPPLVDRTNNPNLVYLFGRNESVYCWNPADNSILWKRETSLAQHPGIIFQGKLIFVAGSWVYAIKTGTGERLWAYRINGPAAGPPVIYFSNPLQVAVPVGNQVICLNLDTGLDNRGNNNQGAINDDRS